MNELPAPNLSWSTYALLQNARWMLSNVEAHHSNPAVRGTIMEARNQLAAIRNALIEAKDLPAAEAFFGAEKVADTLRRIGRWAKQKEGALKA